MNPSGDQRRDAAVRPPFVLAVGGLDPSCGAGIVADARSVQAMGAMPLVVATSITVQSGSGLLRSRAVASALVLEQLGELLRALPVAAVKIGQVPTAATAVALARRLAGAGTPLVLDPVLEASGGGTLAGAAARDAILAHLVPLASLLTVNLDEAAALVGEPVRDLEGMRRAGRTLLGRGADAVLVKGGHLDGDPVDLLCEDGGETTLRATRLPGSMHGTGCALASAAAARLALGDDTRRAVESAREHVRDLLGDAVESGSAGLRRR